MMSEKTVTERTLDKIRAEWEAPLRAEIESLEDALILVCEDEGYLMHGPEGMSDEQQQVYDAILPALERRAAIKEKSDE